MAQIDKPTLDGKITTLTATVATLLADNTSGDISPDDIRQVFTDVVTILQDLSDSVTYS